MVPISRSNEGMGERYVRLCSANTPHSQVQGHLRRPFKPILVMQSSEDRTRRHAMVDAKMMAIALLVHPFRRRIWNAGSEARVGSATVVVSDPISWRKSAGNRGRP